MIIKEINIQNFKSFGNNIQTVKFENDGELILLCGENEHGKSSFQEAFDFSLFGTVRGKERKKIAVKNLPNRDNGHLFTGIHFINEKNDLINMRRFVDPLKLVVYKNGEDYTKEYKVLSESEREDLIGFNYDVYKSFISLNINDFLNFINLDTETKKKLLDRLFNIEELDDYYSITKDILKNYERNKSDILININNNNKVIQTYKDSLDFEDDFLSKDDIKKEVLKLKVDYDQQKEDIQNRTTRLREISSELKDKQELFTNRNNQILKSEVELKNINKKIEVFKKGKCPICKSDLKDDTHQHEMDRLLEEKEGHESMINSLKEENLELKKTNNILIQERNKLLNEKTNLSISFGTLENKIKDLKSQYTNFKGSQKNEILESISKLEKDNLKHQKTLDEVQIKIDKYLKLLDIFSDSGVRKNIIKNVVKPINKHLSEYLKKMESNFTVKLNNEFDAMIFERMINQVPSESLSVGGARKINLAIALSYMEVIFSIRKSNLLFIDEVFSSISETNIGLLLDVFKEFAKKHHTNIVIINHSFMDENVFDRVIRVEKNYFTKIIESKKSI